MGTVLALTLGSLGGQSHFSSQPQGEECLEKDRKVPCVEMFLRGAGRKQKSETCLLIPPQVVVTLTRTVAKD